VTFSSCEDTVFMKDVFLAVGKRRLLLVQRQLGTDYKKPRLICRGFLYMQAGATCKPASASS